MCILYKRSPPCDHAVRNMWYGGSQRCTFTNYVLYAHHRMFTLISSSVCIICLKKESVVTTACSVCGSLPTSKAPKEQAYAQPEDGKGSSYFVACRTCSYESWRFHSSTIISISGFPGRVILFLSNRCIMFNMSEHVQEKTYKLNIHHQFGFMCNPPTQKRK